MKQLDFFFFLGSTYTYLAVNRAAQLAAQHGVALRWRPFSVRTLMKEQDNIPFATKPAKLRYMWRDIERRAGRFGIPFAGPQPYPIDLQEQANHVATLAAMEDWCPDFTRAAYARWFLHGEDPGRPEVLRAILGALGRNADAVLAQADSETVRQRYLQETATARALGLFGSPSFVSEDQELFWGDDRLEDAIAWCQR